MRLDAPRASLRVLCAAAAACILGAWTEPPCTLAPAPQQCAVVYVVDGDALDCKEGPRVRLRGLDTPERGEAGWREARAELARRVLGEVVTLIPHHRNRGRLVADVLLHGENIGEAMHAAGWSKPEGARR